MIAISKYGSQDRFLGVSRRISGFCDIVKSSSRSDAPASYHSPTVGHWTLERPITRFHTGGA